MRAILIAVPLLVLPLTTDTGYAQDGVRPPRWARALHRVRRQCGSVPPNPSRTPSKFERPIPKSTGLGMTFS